MERIIPSPYRFLRARCRHRLTKNPKHIHSNFWRNRQDHLTRVQKPCRKFNLRNQMIPHQLPTRSSRRKLKKSSVHSRTTSQAWRPKSSSTSKKSKSKKLHKGSQIRNSQPPRFLNPLKPILQLQIFWASRAFPWLTWGKETKRLWAVEHRPKRRKNKFTHSLLPQGYLRTRQSPPCNF